MKKPRPDDDPWRAAGLVGAIGAEVVVFILIGYFAGSYLSKWTGGHAGWVIGGVMTGLVAGIVGAGLTVWRFLGGPDE